MMDTQNIIAGMIIFAAVAYASIVAIRKGRTLAPKSKADCSDGCGCSSKSKSPKAVH